MKFKKFIHNVGEFKFLSAMYFMAATMISMVIMTIYGESKFDFITLWEILLLSVIGAGLHHINFLKISVYARTLLHFGLTYGLVILAAYIFHWEFINQFWIFTGIFIAVYCVVFIVWSYYYKLESNALNQKLNEYKEKNI